MIITRDEKLIKRNARIGQMAMLAGLLILGGGMYFSFQKPDQVSLSLGALLFGFIVSQIGIFYMNRWGRKPTLDMMLDVGLKGLDKRYQLYHYNTPVAHLLLGPTGLWVLLPYYQRGNITFRNGRWKQTGGGLMYAYLKIFAQESLGRPDLEVTSETKALLDYLKKKLPEDQIPQIRTALVFLHPKTVIDIPKDENPPAETVMMSDLKETIRKVGKATPLTPEKVKVIQDALLS
jgi:hypothetical protein